MYLYINFNACVHILCNAYLIYAIERIKSLPVFPLSLLRLLPHEHDIQLHMNVIGCNIRFVFNVSKNLEQDCAWSSNIEMSSIY